MCVTCAVLLAEAVMGQNLLSWVSEGLCTNLTVTYELTVGQWHPTNHSSSVVLQGYNIQSALLNFNAIYMMHNQHYKLN